MKTPRIYQSYPLENCQQGHCFDLSTQAFQHLVKVLRKKSGEQFITFDGLGNECLAELSNVEKKSAQATLINVVRGKSCSPLHIHLGQVLSKGERMDYAIQKSVELGVTEITPLFSEYCDVKLPADRIEKKLNHWQKTIISACEQCQQNWLPRINAPIHLDLWIKQSEADLKLMMHTADGMESPIGDEKPKQISLLIGPEGGLSTNEVTQAKALGFKCWQLGPRVFRTETAPIVALSLLQQKWGDF